MNSYRVTFDYRIDGKYYQHQRRVKAENAQDAMRIVRKMLSPYGARGGNFPYHMTAKEIKEGD